MIDLRDVDLDYGAHTVLKDVSFQSGRGESLGIIGPNGSGKTTLLKAISRIVTPSNGTILLDQRELADFAPLELSREIAVVPQASDPGFDFSVRDVVRMGRYPHIGRFGSERDEDRDICCKVMEITGINALTDRSVRAISGGELQRVIIARALAQEPNLLLLDEPTAHLDLGQQMVILQTMKNLSREIAVIGVFHDLNYAAHYCDRLILLHDHRILAMGDPAGVLTEDSIRTAFGIDVIIRSNPFTGRPSISPVYKPEGRNRTCGKVHVICGGGEGSDLLQALHAEGCEVTAGILAVNDSDYRAAKALGIPCIVEPPFSPVTDRSLGELTLALEDARSVILTRGLWGAGNIGNLRVLESANIRKVIILDRQAGEQDEWDYTGGEAEAILERLAAGGAIRVKDIRSAAAAARNTIGGEPCTD
ncbi:MAG: ABC transporter ATP-binding protein [Methanoregulaceae archaeon]|nr:ABC transporter ATP-binding protein [Methanoregulaceae archaeon]